MFNVYDQETARKAYEVIKTFSALNDDVVNGMVAQLKRNLREWTREPHGIEYVNEYFDGAVYHRIVKDNGFDGFVELVTLPSDIDNEPYANKFFHEYVYMDCPNSMYDCTGKAFTSWYKLFKRNGHFYAYHSVCMDV